MTESEKIDAATKFYASFLEYAELLFNGFSVENKLDYEAISKKVKTACEFAQNDRRFLLHAKQVVSPSKFKKYIVSKYLVSHSVRTAIIAVIIGTYLKLPKYRLIELGVAALLSDIGLLQLPPEAYLESYVMSGPEKKLVFAHPVQAYKILKSFNFPVSVCVAALEHQERENGTGYPQNLTGDRISLYGKIISVACSYEVYSTKEINEEKCGHTGMMKLLKNEEKRFDESVVRALVYSLSLYPVGLYVLLSDGKQAQVVDVDPENPRYPFVQILGERNHEGKRIVAQTFPKYHIVRPLTKDEVGPH